MRRRRLNLNQAPEDFRVRLRAAVEPVGHGSRLSGRGDDQGRSVRPAPCAPDACVTPETPGCPQSRRRPRWEAARPVGFRPPPEGAQL